MVKAYAFSVIQLTEKFKRLEGHKNNIVKYVCLYFCKYLIVKQCYYLHAFTIIVCYLQVGMELRFPYKLYNPYFLNLFLGPSECTHWLIQYSSPGEV